jgi:acyl carrier protein
VINMYGPTETTLYVTCRQITGADVVAGAGSIIGLPLPDIRIYLLDARGRPVPVGVAGELYIAGGGVADGYLNRPELTAQRFLVDPFHGGRMYRSGDLARRLEDGELEYLGRIDQQVKIRGFRVELGEIETVIGEHCAVRQVAVIDREDSPGDKKLVAYLVAPDPPPTLVADLRQLLHTRLPEYMVPAHFQHLDALPLTTSGKLDRKALPTPQHQPSGNRNPYAAPRNPAEQTIAEIWRTVLRVDSVGLDDHFFELGGDSLLSIRVHAQLTDRLRADLPIVALLQYPTVRTLARHLADEHPGAATVGAAMDRARKHREACARRRELIGKR